MPVLFADRDASVVGVAHAGWRGLAAGVLENTIAAMGCNPARRSSRGSGPAIGRRAFEVGADVRDAFVAPGRSARTAFAPSVAGQMARRSRSAGAACASRARACTRSTAAACARVSDPRASSRSAATARRGRMAAFVWRERLAMMTLLHIVVAALAGGVLSTIAAARDAAAAARVDTGLRVVRRRRAARRRVPRAAAARARRRAARPR